MKVVSIVGTRPQFIKLSQVSKQVRRVADEVIIHTGQHYDNEMDRVFFDELGIPDPDYNLCVGSGSHGWQTGEMLRKIEETLILERPDTVLVYGDCNTTLAGALASVKMGIPLGHVESGCRTYLKVPEEINRRCVDHISDLLFAISEGTAQTLEDENVLGRIFNVGSTIVDACIHFSKVIKNTVNLEDYFVLTLHRPANVDMAQEIGEILEAIYQIEMPIVFPIHPRTHKTLSDFGLLEKLKQKKNIHITPPLGYLDFLALLRDAHMIISDSGSIQQEVITLRKKCVRIRSYPPFPELGDYPGGIGVKPYTMEILQAIKRLDGVDDATLNSWKTPLGDGNASRRIAEIIENEA